MSVVQRSQRQLGLRGRVGAWPLVAPAVLVLLALTAWPLGRLLWTSLHRSSVSAPADDSFVGLGNYLDVLSSRTWWLAVAVTLGLVLASVVLQLLLAAGVAATIRRVIVGPTLLRVLVLLPFAVLGLATASSWRGGLVDGFGPEWFGYDGSSAGATIAAVVASEVWRGTGITALILLAGLERIPDALRDATIADGATSRQLFTRLILPASMPALAVAVLYRSLDALRAFEGPLLAQDSTDLRTVPLLLWDSAYQRFEAGLAATIAVLLLLLAAVVGSLLLLLLRPRPLRWGIPSGGEG